MSSINSPAHVSDRLQADDFEGNRALLARLNSRIGRMSTVHWEDLATAATVLPELAKEAEGIIFLRLGFLPAENQRAQTETFIRGLIQAHRQSSLTDEDFNTHVEAACLTLRNAWVEQEGWLDIVPYPASMLSLYGRYNSEFAAQARERITHMCGFAPEVDWSLEAELTLRGLFCQDQLHLGQDCTDMDYRLATIVYYRRELMTKGRAAADGLTPLGTFITALYATNE